MVNKNIVRKIFISYSWSSPAHEKFVIELAERLTIDGVEVLFDKWELKEGQDKYAFMEKMVNDETVNKVLIISDKKYEQKANARKGGVGNESQIISSEIYNKVDQTKFIPIVTEFDENGNPFLPIFLKSRIYINLADENVYLDEYDKLLRNIYDKPLYKKPILGAPPVHILEESIPSVKTTIKFNVLKEAVIKEKIISKTLSSEYFNFFLETLEEFRVPNKANDTRTIDDQIVDSINSFLPYQKELLQVFKLLIETTNDFYYYEAIFKFFEKFITYKYPPPELNQYNETWFDNYCYLLMEAFLYLSALLLNSNK
ncbi:MAG: TIR domain-containing protein, partial [Bacteroidetes bacterium]|nr:TIR domain-containing protein [Bacteroidota bacterium]MBU1680143.1 TIR domain-containing protein [Bacteroidota bacterium]